MPDLTELADLNGAAEAIWQTCVPHWPTLSIDVLPEVDSTNTMLMARGRQGDTTPALVAARRQLAGRGRQGRTWLAAPDASLTFSLGLVLPLDQIPGGGSALSLAVGVLLATQLERGLARCNDTAAPLPPRAAIGLKWPNDLLLGGRKLGGILIEASPAPGLREGERWVVVGVGLNVRRPADPPTAAGLDEALWPTADAPELSPGQVWRWLAPDLLDGIARFAHTGFAALQADYAQRDVLAGQEVGLWTTPGGAALDTRQPPAASGLAQGVDASGALLVHTPQGLQRWTSGEVSVRLRPSTPTP
jgi:BirA family biotin operon repressor/biotin-[acetyl-CoA-carboxylase] ligase